MPRKKIIPELTGADRFDDMVVEAIWGTTIEERSMIARSFESGDISLLLSIRIQDVTPEALLITSLVDAESRLVFAGYKLRAQRLMNLVKVISKLDQFRKLKIYQQTSHRSVDKSTKTVENYALPVDKTVENLVEKSTPPVDKFAVMYSSPQSGPDLSPACGKVISLSTGPVDNFEGCLQSDQSLFKDSSPDEIPDDLSTPSTKPTTTAISTHI